MEIDAAQARFVKPESRFALIIAEACYKDLRLINQFRDCDDLPTCAQDYLTAIEMAMLLGIR